MLNTNLKSDNIIVVIDGFPSSHWRICLSERPNIATPERQVQTEQVIGRLGGFYTEFGWNDMEVTLNFNYLEDVIDFKAFKQQVPHIIKWLQHGKKLQFSDEPNVYYLMRKVSINKDIANDIVEYGEFSVVVTLAPFGRVIEDTPVDLLQGLSSSTTPLFVVIFNASIETSYPKFEINTTGKNFRLNVLNYDTGKENWIQTNSTLGASLPTGKLNFVVDSENKIFYYYDQQTDKKILISDYTTSGEFPKLASGENRIELTVPQDNPEIGFYDLNMYRNMLR